MKCSAIALFFCINLLHFVPSSEANQDSFFGRLFNLLGLRCRPKLDQCKQELNAINAACNNGSYSSSSLVNGDFLFRSRRQCLNELKECEKGKEEMKKCETKETAEPATPTLTKDKVIALISLRTGASGKYKIEVVRPLTDFESQARMFVMIVWRSNQQFEPWKIYEFEIPLDRFFAYTVSIYSEDGTGFTGGGGFDFSVDGNSVASIDETAGEFSEKPIIFSTSATMMPTTVMPTASMPTTSMPTTSMPTTSMPTTSMPTTLMPTTSMPTILMITTSMPTIETVTSVTPEMGEQSPLLVLGADCNACERTCYDIDVICTSFRSFCRFVASISETGIALINGACDGDDFNNAGQELVAEGKALLLERNIFDEFFMNSVDIKFCSVLRKNFNAYGFAISPDLIWFDPMWFDKPITDFAKVLVHEYAHIIQWRTYSPSFFKCEYAKGLVGSIGLVIPPCKAIWIEEEACTLEDSMANCIINNIDCPEEPITSLLSIIENPSITPPVTVETPTTDVSITQAPTAEQENSLLILGADCNACDRTCYHIDIVCTSLRAFCRFVASISETGIALINIACDGDELNNAGQELIAEGKALLLERNIFDEYFMNSVDIKFCSVLRKNFNAYGFAISPDLIWFDPMWFDKPITDFAKVLVHEYAHIIQWRTYSPSFFKCEYAKGLVGSIGLSIPPCKAIWIEEEACELEDYMANCIMNDIDCPVEPITSLYSIIKNPSTSPPVTVKKPTIDVPITQSPIIEEQNPVLVLGADCNACDRTCYWIDIGCNSYRSFCRFVASISETGIALINGACDGDELNNAGQELVAEGKALLLERNIFDEFFMNSVDIKFCSVLRKNFNAYGFAISPDLIWFDPMWFDKPITDFAKVLVHEYAHIIQWRTYSPSFFKCEYAKGLVGSIGLVVPPCKAIWIEEEACALEDSMANCIMNNIDCPEEPITSLTSIIESPSTAPPVTVETPTTDATLTQAPITNGGNPVIVLGADCNACDRTCYWIDFVCTSRRSFCRFVASISESGVTSVNNACDHDELKNSGQDLIAEGKALLLEKNIFDQYFMNSVHIKFCSVLQKNFKTKSATVSPDLIWLDPMWQREAITDFAKALVRAYAYSIQWRTYSPSYFKCEYAKGLAGTIGVEIPHCEAFWIEEEVCALEYSMTNCIMNNIDCPEEPITSL